jgi:hypothetical protein
MLIAGVKGFEPLHGGIKNRCLTTWLYSMEQNKNTLVFLLRQLAPNKQGAT